MRYIENQVLIYLSEAVFDFNLLIDSNHWKTK